MCVEHEDDHLTDHAWVAARLREDLGEHHFEFLNGDIPIRMGDDETTAGENIDDDQDRYGYLGEPSDVRQYQELLDGLIDVVQSQGPFDGIMGFSEGGIIAATLLVEDSRRPFANFKCGIFFSAAPPLDPDDLAAGIVRSLDPAKDAVSIFIPTAHVYSHESTTRTDVQSPLQKVWAEIGWSTPEQVHSSLARLCDNRQVFVHDQGHQVPGQRDQQALRGTLRVIDRTIKTAED
ncbi:hypothetical protein CkaCkLH20_09763 [Colletotrichum karsti]|uniref:Serine hydrolase domain-containing protein n=1 Tax=Colletotrichum karsti TaxID=1095194 RepID=A0A9P6HZA0_9PEZI|nr:uncharacterized protein CkaCkLH20_09763 [Colletotrichum karsti]KAF9872900.1 hypothetical protein CkaCkLH20_09763 [Colletotrichum karsti]